MNSTKKAIFDSAIRIFSTHGYNGATMEEISQSAGVAKGTLYYYFKSKEEIFHFIMKQGLAMLKEHTMVQLKNADNDEDRLRGLCLSQLNLVHEHKDFLKVVISQLWGEHTRQQELRKEMLVYLKELEQYLRITIDNRIIKDENISLISCSILGAICSLAIHEMIDGSKSGLVSESLGGDRIVDKQLESKCKEAVACLQGNACGSDNHRQYDVDKLMEYLLYGIGA